MFNRYPFLVLTASLLLILGGCEVQSRVQGRYIAAQDDCRSIAEDKVAKSPNVDQMTPEQHSAAVVNEFSQCMNKAGWHVANPLKGKEPPPAGASTAPAGSPPATTSPAKQVAPAPATNNGPAPVVPAASAAPSDVAPPAHYERNVDSPTDASNNGRQF